MRLGLGLDAGGTATRWALADATGALIARGEGPPLSGHVFSPAAETRSRDIIADLAAAILPHGTPHAILSGVTGTSRSSPEAAILARLMAAAFGVGLGAVEVTDDIGLLHRAHFPPGRGILIYSGTGSAACHVAADGTELHVGGLGHLIDDGGSGYAIARDALRAVLRREEAAPGSGWDTALGRGLAGAIGGQSWDQVRAHVYGGDRARMAALAPAVGQAARGGDPLALDVLDTAGAELARLAEVLMQRVGPQEVALVGGALRLHPRLHESLAKCVGRPVATPDIDAAAACARRAADTA